ncbi:replicative DNA helicase [Thiomicrospira sp. WB1]|uniref:replicative DNA helicase n=1 Tax=Thiomicrospira sp. WB1 TaxID=1685380 RepID=UPI00074784DD|nr:replicative DNA helicase [Thiomicrospira sp. WB1]KUJ72145.1 replicative DNA helicase [Thiomicrospira sp. WB1]
MSQSPEFKTPPHSIDAEQSVIGGLLLDNDKLTDVSGILTPSDFYTQQHQRVFESILALSQAEKPFDLVTVIAQLQASGELETIGGKSYLMELVDNTPGAANITFYAQVVRDKSILRALIQASNEISEQSYFPQGKEVTAILDAAESRILKIAEQGSGNQRDYQTIKHLLNDALVTLQQRMDSDGITGLATSWSEFDEVTSGLQKGDLVIVAGRPSMGKTSFCMNMAENVAIKEKAPVAVFSMEMPGEQLVMRMFSSVGRVDAEKIRKGNALEDEDWGKITLAMNQMSQAKIFIDDTPALMINDLRARVRRIDKDVRDQQLKEAEQHPSVLDGSREPHEFVTGLGMIVVDYLQLMRGSIQTDNRVNEISEISRGLKAIAKEINVPVVALSQLSRNLEQRPDKRPKMADLRESGAIEQDADLIIFIYRDEVYNPDSADKGKAEIILGKHRNGALANIPLAFLGHYTRFENFTAMDDQADEYY